MKTEDIQNPVALTEFPSIKSTVFIFERCDTGTWKHTPGEVVDLIDRPRTVKVRFAVGLKLTSKWFPLTQLTATHPMEEMERIKKKAERNAQ